MIGPLPRRDAADSGGWRHIARLGERCRSCWRMGVDFLYPYVCPGCGSYDGAACASAADSVYPSLCGRCRNALAITDDKSCARCGAPVGPFLNSADGCIHCRRQRFAFDTVIRLGVYRDALRQACLMSKCPGGGGMSAGLAQLLWLSRRDEFGKHSFDLVTGIPFHWSRRLLRPHNASLTLARVLARCLQVEFAQHILRKVRRTAAQSSLPPGKRRTNLKRVFNVNREVALDGLSILLVDDILTTGTTAHEASKIIRRNGARRVVVAVVARGLGHAADRK